MRKLPSTPRHHPAWPIEREAAAIALAKNGVSTAEIGRRFLITKNSVIGALDRAVKAGRWEPPPLDARIAIQFPNPTAQTFTQAPEK